jgi:hypothetical protein
MTIQLMPWPTVVPPIGYVTVSSGLSLRRAGYGSTWSKSPSLAPATKAAISARV